MRKFVFVLLAALLVSFHLSATEKAPTKKVTLALNWVPEHEFGGFYAAKLFKIYEKHGLDVEIIAGGPGSPTISMIAAGKVDFGITSGGEVIVARARGAKVKAVYAVYQKSPLILMAHQSRGFKTFSDLFKGGVLAIERGHAVATFLERKFGFSKIKVVPYTGGVAAFLHDPLFVQQGFATSEPLSAKRQGGDPQIFLLADIGFNPYMETITVSDEFLNKNEATVRAMVEATREGWQLYLKNSLPTNQYMSTLNKSLDLATFEEGAKAQIPFIEDAFTRKNNLGTMTAARWKQQSEQLLELKATDKIFPPGDYFLNF